MLFFNFKRWVKHTIQKIVRGWSDRETWNLDHTMAVWLLPRLKKFKELNILHPMEFKNKKEWDKVLDKMIFSLQYVVDDYEDFKDLKEWNANHKKVEEGLQLIGKYWQNLWW